MDVDDIEVFEKLCLNVFRLSKRAKLVFCPRPCRLGEKLSSGQAQSRLKSRLGEQASPGRQMPRLGENAQDLDEPLEDSRLGEKGLTWARKATLGCQVCVWARKAQMASNNTHIRDYHFTMSPMGQWASDGHKYTDTGPCGLSLHMVCNSRAVRSSGLGGGPCKKASVLRMPSHPNYASGIWHHDMEEDEEEEDEVIELVDIESLVEVIDLVSDSEEEEDPNEGSIIPGIF
ncbi:unnamed protein product [Lupinus luteus]|uniref:Uncharacterized protein n=1 Tax=Lupinus luteus TaxID=3873 RepID=A0AAV1WEG4_LUPLU